MNKNIILPFLLLLSACVYVDGPEDWPLTYKQYEVTIIPVETQSIMQEKFGHLEPNIQVRGYAYWSGDKCVVWYIHSDYEYLIHELKHCYYGKWHGEYK